MLEDDRSFKLGVLASVCALAAALGGVRFCSGVDLPPKPPMPRVDTASVRDALASADATPLAYKTYVEGDAAKIGVSAPTIASMGRKLVYRVDESHHGLSPGDAPLEVAGLRLTVRVEQGDNGDDLVLAIDNPGDVDLAYDVVTKPSYGNQVCQQRSLRSLNAMVVTRRSGEKRIECLYRQGMVLSIEKVETLEVSPLESYYVSRVPPMAVGVEPRLSQGHKPFLPGGVSVCNLAMSQSIRAALEDGSIGWRDLVDFYARHRCDTYQFPEGYRAFVRDGEKPLPVTGTGG